MLYNRHCVKEWDYPSGGYGKTYPSVIEQFGVRT